MNLVDIERMNDSVTKLANGIDPTTDVKFSEDTILNNRLLQNLFNEISEVLEEILDGRLIKSDGKLIKKKVRKK